MNKLTFTLEQHTPLIHFQPDQQGATLRASEVKPKLDRFIIEKLCGGLYENGIKIAREKGWILKKNDNPSLNYKLKIVGNDNLFNSKVEPTSPFFGNIKVDEEKKKKLSYFKTLSFYFTSDNSILKDIMFEEYLNEFLFLNNFGSRNTKGFGSFTLIPKNTAYSENVRNNRLAEFYKYSFVIENANYKDVFYSIDLFNKIVRSGYNINGLYIKALSYFYAESKGWQWDKRSIKEKFPQLVSTNNTTKFNYTSNSLIGGNLPFIRGILGLGTNQSWGSKILHIIDEKKEYERYASPIHFKPVLNEDKSITVFFDWIDKKNGVWGKTFTHYVDDNQNDLLNLTVPNRNDFKPEEFMEFISKASPRQFLNFRLELRLFNTRLVDNKCQLDDNDKSILIDWKNSKRGRCFVIQDLPMDKLGLDNFSLFDYIKEKEFKIITFTNIDKVKDFIDGFIPKKQLKALDSIFNQLNNKIITP